MKLGLFAYYGYDLPLSVRLRHIKEAGFASTMLWWGDEPTPLPQFDGGALSAAKGLGLAVENVHIPYRNANDLWSPDPETRQNYEAELQGYARYCGQHELPMVVMHVSRMFETLEPTRAGIETMKRLVSDAEKDNLVIAIENTRSVGLIEAILDEIESSCLGLCYDTSHGRLYEQEQFHLLRRYPHRLKCLHLSDNDGLEDKHWNLGQGVIDWNGFIALFSQKTECKTLSLEVFPKDKNELETVFLRQACDAAGALRDSIAKGISSLKGRGH